MSAISQTQPPAEIQRVVAASRRTAFRSESRFLRVIMWPLWAFLDEHTGRPSGPKCMAWAIYGASLAGRPIAASVCVLLLATMFGYSMFKGAMDKATLALSSADSVAVALTHARTTSETTTTANTNTRIDAHYTIDGSGANVPKESLPAVPGAKTPSGDD